MATDRVHVRWMIRRDMPEVLGIERDSFEFPWFEEDFIHCLRQRSCIGMVAERAEVVIGFMIYELHKSRLQLLTFGVSAVERRRGIGTRMVDKLKSKLATQRRISIRTEIRERNVAAQMFFHANGFRATKVLREFYDDSPEDAYEFVYRYDVEDCRRAAKVFGLAYHDGAAID